MLYYIFPRFMNSIMVGETLVYSCYIHPLATLGACLLELNWFFRLLSSTGLTLKNLHWRVTSWRRVSSLTYWHYQSRSNLKESKKEDNDVFTWNLAMWKLTWPKEKVSKSVISVYVFVTLPFLLGGSFDIWETPSYMRKPVHMESND